MGNQSVISAGILIVDDDELVRRTFRDILETNGYQVGVASDGREGLAFLAAQPVDVVLLDLKLPDMNGLEVLKRIKGSHPDVAVLMITGYASVESAVEAIQLGAYDYMVKPCTAEELRLRVARVLEKVRLEQELPRAEEIFQALDEAALSVQTARGLDEAFRYIGEQVRAMGMECILYQRSGSSPDELMIRYLSFPGEQIGQVEELLGTEIGALRVRCSGRTFLTETLVNGTAQWHPLEERFLQVLFPPAKKDALAQIRTILGGSVFVHAPLRGEGDICGVLVMLGSQLTERDVLAVVAFAHQLSVFLENIRWEENVRFLGMVMHELRSISTDLRPPILDDLGLISALQWYTQVYRERCTDIRFSTNLDKLDLSKEEEIAVFRIVQEALSNAVWHGRAKRITVRVEEADDAVQIAVQDDGVGFEMEQTLDGLWSGEGMGLISMRERAWALNAELTIESRTGQGTSVSLAVPIKAKGKGDA